MTGNKASETLVGRDQFLMSLFLIIFPDAEADEIALFIYNNGGQIYERFAISKRMQELGLTKKIASTEAYQAFTPENVLKAELFWTRAPPLGVVGIPRYKFMDLDEFGIAIQRINKKYGHSHSTLRIRKAGHYCRDTKLTVLLGIEPGDPRLPAHFDGSIEKPRRWIRVVRVGGTTVELFSSFVNQICNDIETNFIPNTDNHRVFLWDNLTSHRAPLVAQTVEARNGPCQFTIVHRPPYQPKYAPVEYKICDLIAYIMSQVERDWTTDTLEQELINSMARVGNNGNFWNTFDHCGYSINGLYL
jgi:hypothetical protein